LPGILALAVWGWNASYFQGAGKVFIEKVACRQKAWLVLTWKLSGNERLIIEEDKRGVIPRKTGNSRDVAKRRSGMVINKSFLFDPF
jgi:hypothetical protein